MGEPVHARFGDEFPIRFDFLDTMQGGNLSLQVHPLTEYIQEKFGMHYTQDESYYIMDAEEGARVYLGLKEGVVPGDMVQELGDAQAGGKAFNTEKHVQTWPAKKHDHFLIPAGTVHCSGANSMVLEISATPYIFTFKLWDWGRLGIDGKPRPINIEHGKNVIQWDRTTEWTRKNLVNRVEKVAGGLAGLRNVQGCTSESLLKPAAGGLPKKPNTTRMEALTCCVLLKENRFWLKAL
jgi:mannose-6-phosphate isomerase class I